MMALPYLTINVYAKLAGIEHFNHRAIVNVYVNIDNSFIGRESNTPFQ